MNRPLVFIASLFAATVEAKETRTAFVVIGKDSQSVAALQQRIEAALAREGIEIDGRNELGPRLGIERHESEALRTLFAEVQAAYVEDRHQDALDALNRVSRFLNAGLGEPGFDRASFHAWRSAVYLAKGEVEYAATEARELLAVAPETRPSLDVFRPSFAKFIDEARAASPRPVAVRVLDTPPRCTYELDGAFVAKDFKISPGPHKLTVRSPGSIPATVSFEARADLTLRVPLALDAGPEGGTIQAKLHEGQGEAAVVALQRRLSSDALAVVVVRGERIQAALRLRDEPLEQLEAVPMKDHEQVVDWLVRRIGARNAVVRAPAVAPGLAFQTSVEAVSSTRQIAVGFASAPGFESTLGGWGSAIAATAAYGPLTASGRLIWLSFAQSTTDFETSEQTYSVHGGTLLEGRAAASRSFDLTRVLLAPHAGARFEQDSSGGRPPFAAYPAYSRVDAIVGIGVKTVAAGVVIGELELNALPNLSWRSRNGWPRSDPPVAVELQAGASWRTGGWELGARYEALYTAADFDGAYPISSSVPLRDPQTRETRHSFALRLGRRFH